MSTQSGPNEILEAFLKVAPYLPVFFDDTASIAITDTEKFIINQICPSLPIKADPGTLIPEGGAAYRAIKTGEIVISEVPKEVYGVPFRSYAMPVKQDGNVVGCVLLGKSLQKSYELHEAYKIQTTALQQISDAIHALTSELQHVVAMTDDIQKEVNEAEENTKTTDEILSFIRHVSSQTNLLGLNAAIEAARAGEHGKGFNVVAQEIRKLSNSTNESVKKVNLILKQISNSTKAISEKISNAYGIYQSQAAVFEEIASSIEELTTSAKKLEDMAKEL